MLARGTSSAFWSHLKISTDLEFGEIIYGNASAKKRKCACLIYEMLFIHELRPSLNVQTDSIRVEGFLNN